MLGLMQNQELLDSSIITHAARLHPAAEVVSRLVDGAVHRTTYREIEARARLLAAALRGLGVGMGDRVATLAWNSHRHVELYYAVSGMGAVIHTVNPRLSADDIAFILGDAGSAVLCADLTFVPIVEAIAALVPSVRAVVLLAEAGQMPAVALAPGQELVCYETLVGSGSEGFAWPALEEGLACGLCYTSGTTGRPKGVLYSHRSTVLHAYAISLPDVFGFRAVDRVLPVVPMFHVNAWGLPYAAPLVGASLVMPGRHLDGPSLHAMLQAERVTFTAGVPTVWMGLLQHLRASGGRLDHLRRLIVGGAACPPALMEAFEREFGVEVTHAWGMSEMSPVGTCFAPKPGAMAQEEGAPERVRLKQGRVLPGVDMRIVDDAKRALPWDGVSFGNLEVRGPWICRRYFGAAADAVDAEGWFATGDVATIDRDGYTEITDRTKDVIKSGGEWISSIQLENIAVSHPDVAEAAVVAVRHKKWDERPVLVVVPRPDRTLDPAEVLALYAGKVPKWWVPDEVVVVEELPHTATGKLNKLALRQRFRDYALAGAE